MGIAPTLLASILKVGVVPLALWTAAPTLSTRQWTDVCYSDDLSLFVAVSNSGDANRVATSPDGITWTARAAAESNEWRVVHYAAGLFVAFAQSGTNRCMTSANGIDWTIRAVTAGVNWTGITYGNRLWVAVNSNGGTAHQIYRSTDGTTWTPTTTPAAATLGSVTFGNGVFIALGINSNLYLRSTDGITWTSNAVSPTGRSFYRITYSDGWFVALAYNTPTNMVYRSQDGLTWESITLDSGLAGSIESIDYRSGRLLAASIDAGGNNHPITSTDNGATWVESLMTDVQLASSIWHGVAMSSNRAVLVAYTGTAGKYAAYAPL